MVQSSFLGGQIRWLPFRTKYVAALPNLQITLSAWNTRCSWDRLSLGECLLVLSLSLCSIASLHLLNKCWRFLLPVSWWWGSFENMEPKGQKMTIEQCCCCNWVGLILPHAWGLSALFTNESRWGIWNSRAYCLVRHSFFSEMAAHAYSV